VNRCQRNDVTFWVTTFVRGREARYDAICGNDLQYAQVFMMLVAVVRTVSSSDPSAVTWVCAARKRNQSPSESSGPLRSRVAANVGKDTDAWASIKLRPAMAKLSAQGVTLAWKWKGRGAWGT